MKYILMAPMLVISALQQATSRPALRAVLIG
jgi:hypothetical protein